MIKVNTPSSRAINTGAAIDKPASTFIQNGPRDELATVDAYSGTPTTSGGGGSGSAGGSGGGSANGAVDPSGKSIVDPRYARIANRSKQLGKRALSVGSGNLWTAILCGAFDPRNETSDERRAKMENSAVWLRSTGCSAENLMDLIDVKNGRFTINQSLLDERISSALGESIHTLDPEMKEELRRSYYEMTGQDLDVLLVNVDGQQSSVGSDRYEETNAFLKVLRKVPGAEESVQVLDLHAEVLVLGGILDKAIDLGLPQAVDTVLAKVEDDRVRKEVVLSRVRPAAVASNLKVVREAVRLNSRDVVVAKVPDLVAVILRHYRFPSPATRVNYGTYRDELLTTLDMVDPQWAKTPRASDNLSYLGPFVDASEDALTLLSDSPYAVEVLLAKSYPERDQKQIAGYYHPMVYL